LRVAELIEDQPHLRAQARQFVEAELMHLSRRQVRGRVVP